MNDRSRLIYMEESQTDMKIENGLPVRLMTKNIRYATASPSKGEETWEVRRPYLIKELRFHTAHCDDSFLCLQEVLHQQIIDIQAGLNGEWDYIGVGRDDGLEAGEYSPIFFRRLNWKCQAWNTVWLSKTPEKPSKSWDAACFRILTVGVFMHRCSGKKLVAMNTHLDDQGSRSRLEGAKIILSQIEKYATRGAEPRMPVFVAGDFNSEPHQEAYLEATGDSSPMIDLHSLVPEAKQYGDTNTFTGFDSETRRKKIDFIFLSQNASKTQSNAISGFEDHALSWLADGYSVSPNRFEDGVYNSDHQAVIGDLRLS
ncbi:MAG: hypothetical protein Q9217_004052 [Psora testacea]